MNWSDNPCVWGQTLSQQTGPQKTKELLQVQSGYVGHNHPETSHAMEQKALIKSGTLRYAIYNLLLEFGPLTDDELEQVLERSHQSVSGSRRTLVIDGYVRETPIRRINRYGNEAIAWEAIGDVAC